MSGAGASIRSVSGNKEALVQDNSRLAPATPGHCSEFTNASLWQKKFHAKPLAIGVYPAIGLDYCRLKQPLVDWGAI